MESFDFKVKCNVMLIGKSGAGKSSLANYIFGVEEFTTGTGEPVTDWTKNFQHKAIDVKGVLVDVYDSVGLEQTNSERWILELRKFLDNKYNSSRGVVSANDLMHSIIYVINGASGRAEDLKVLSKIKDYNISKFVVITNCDVASDEQICGIEEVVKTLNLKSIHACSVIKRTRGGQQVNPYGRNEVLEKILSASYNSVGKQLTIAVLGNVIDYISSIKLDLFAKIDKANLSVFNLSNINDELAKIFNFNNFDIDEEQLIPSSFSSYYNFIENFDIDFEGKDDFCNAFDFLSSINEGFIENFGSMKIMDEVLEKLENGNFFEQIEAIFAMASKILFLKNFLKDTISEIFEEVIRKIDEEKRKLEK